VIKRDKDRGDKTGEKENSKEMHQKVCLSEREIERERKR
jgi:hypothetical protein